MKLSLEQVRHLRLCAQRLHPETNQSVAGIAQLVRDVGGFQAQELPSATLAVRPRSQNLVAEDVKQAREEDRSIVLTWTMRGTMHLLTSEDLKWLLPFFGPLFIGKAQHRYTQLGLDEEMQVKVAGIIAELLGKHGPLTRPELAELLAFEGIPVDGQSIHHLVRYAALAGVICYGPEKDGRLTYVLLEEWLGWHREEALGINELLTRLAHNYLFAFGPAAPEDLASWSGITISQARTGFKMIEGELLDVDAAGSPAWMLASQADWLDVTSVEHIVSLLPRYDTYLLGYQSRDFMLAASYAKRVHPGGGIIKAALIVDGLIKGVWRVNKKKYRSTIIVEPFEPIQPETTVIIEKEVADLARFLDLEIELKIESG